MHEGDAVHPLRLLCRGALRRGREQQTRNKFPSPHSITSSAWASSVGRLLASNSAIGCPSTPAAYFAELLSHNGIPLQLSVESFHVKGPDRPMQALEHEFTG